MLTCQFMVEDGTPDVIALDACQVSDAVQEVLRTQWESAEGDAFDWTIWDEGRLVASGKELIRYRAESGLVQVVVFRWKTEAVSVATWYVEYKLDSDGSYDHTEITLLG